MNLSVHLSKFTRLSVMRTFGSTSKKMTSHWWWISIWISEPIGISSMSQKTKVHGLMVNHHMKSITLHKKEIWSMLSQKTKNGVIWQSKSSKSIWLRNSRMRESIKLRNIPNGMSQSTLLSVNILKIVRNSWTRIDKEASHLFLTWTISQSSTMKRKDSKKKDQTSVSTTETRRTMNLISKRIRTLDYNQTGWLLRKSRSNWIKYRQVSRTGEYGVIQSMWLLCL